MWLGELKGHVVDVPVFEVIKRDQQERVQETTAELKIDLKGWKCQYSCLETTTGLRAACWLFGGCGGVCLQGGSSGQYPAADF